MPNVEIDMRGFDALQRRLKALEDVQSVPLTDLLPVAFLTRYTEFTSLEAMIAASGLVLESKEDFEQNAWHDFVRSHTQFSDWKEMLNKAVEEWVARQLRL
jgi:hypothetical protein